MILDQQNILSDRQDLAQAAGNYLSTNKIDLGGQDTIVLLGTSAVRDFGSGSVAELLVQIVETFTSAGAATLQVQVVTADDAALTANLTVHVETPAIALADLVAGYKFKLGRLPNGLTQRYFGLRFVIGAAATTAGKVTAGIVLNRQQGYVY